MRGNARGLDFGRKSAGPGASVAQVVPRPSLHFPSLPDLGVGKGRARWLRAVAIALALSGAALSLLPAFAPVRAAALAPIDDAAGAELRANTLQSLAAGSRIGRRMDMTAAVVPLEAAPERATVDLTVTLGDGDSFGRMLQRAGVGALDAARTADIVAQKVPLNQIEPGTRVRIVLGQRVSPSQPRPLTGLAFRPRLDLDLAIQRQGEKLVATSRAIPVDTTPLRIKGAVGSSLYRSARAAGTPASAVQEYLRALNRHIALGEDLHPADEFDIIVAFKRAATGEIRAGEVLYAGLNRQGKPRAQLLRWGADGEFFEASGMTGTQSASALIAPVAGRITSGFGMRRHPILGFTRMHAGMDFGAPWGAPIYAATDGAVVFAGNHGGHGQYVKLDHGGGVGTGYAHMSRIAVQPGQRVRKGQVIGFVGSSGLSTGPHLHYELYRNGMPVNPASVGFIMQAQVDPAQMAAFKARLAQMQAIRPRGAPTGPLAMK